MSRHRKVFLIAAVATSVAAAAAVGVVKFIDTENRRVDPSTIVHVNQPDPVAVNAPVVAAPAETDYSEVFNVTEDVARGFEFDLSEMRSRLGSPDVQPIPVVAQPDECLLEWATTNLAELATTGTYAVMDVCGRRTAVLAGPAGADSKVLTYGALEDTAPEGMRETLAESTGTTMVIAAVTSKDEEALLIATAELP